MPNNYSLSPLPPTQLQYFSSEDFELINTSPNHYTLRLKFGAAHADFVTTTTGIDIKYMCSNVPHGGASLHEYLFRLSSRYPQLDGKIYLEAAWGSEYFHYLSGFRGENYFTNSINLIDPTEHECETESTKALFAQLKRFLSRLDGALNNKQHRTNIEYIRKGFKAIFQLLIDFQGELLFAIYDPTKQNETHLSTDQDRHSSYNVADAHMTQSLLNDFEHTFRALFPNINDLIDQKISTLKSKDRLKVDTGSHYMYLPLCIIQEKKTSLMIQGTDQRIDTLSLEDIQSEFNRSTKYIGMSERYAISYSKYADSELENMAKSLQARLINAASKYYSKHEKQDITTQVVLTSALISEPAQYYSEGQSVGFFATAVKQPLVKPLLPETSSVSANIN
jgi:hypothetical protein